LPTQRFCRDAAARIDDCRAMKAAGGPCQTKLARLENLRWQIMTLDQAATFRHSTSAAARLSL
jgi:hypothetical protein